LVGSVIASAKDRDWNGAIEESNNECSQCSQSCSRSVPSPSQPKQRLFPVFRDFTFGRTTLKAIGTFRRIFYLLLGTARTMGTSPMNKGVGVFLERIGNWERGNGLSE
jgi:hypothetical protein